MAGGATIGDVAQRAGVSAATVSRVMNGNESVDPALAERVREAATALNYSASPLARSLVLRRTQTIAVIVPDLGNPTFQEILHGLSRAARHDGYHVLVADSAESLAEERVLARETRQRADGVVLCAPRMPDDELDALLPDLAPAVVVNRSPRSTAPVVQVDYGAGLTDLLEHLYAHGHRRLAYLAGTPASASNRARLAAVAAFRADRPEATVDELPGGVGFSDGAAAAETVLASGATAVLAYNDLVAMGLLSALEGHGVRIPGDLSLVGFDDIPFARYTSPPLTTATVQAAEVGEQAWAALARILSGGRAGDATTFRPMLEVRGTSGDAPAGKR